MIHLPPEFLEFLKLLNRNEVKYLLIGGYAVAYYGFVRATGDMDIFVECSNDNAEKLARACHDFGLGSAVSSETFLEPGSILRFGVPPMRLEILNEISGVGFNECWGERDALHLPEVDVPIISLNRLLQNKRASGRPKDLVDIDQISGSNDQ